MDRVKSTSKYQRISPRKARLAADLIRGLPVATAATQLTFSNLKGGRMLKKTLDTAVADAENNFDLDRNELVVLEVRVDEGPTWKRAKPRNRGSRSPIMKRTSHLTVVVGSQEGVV